MGSNAEAGPATHAKTDTLPLLHDQAALGYGAVQREADRMPPVAPAAQADQLRRFLNYPVPLPRYGVPYEKRATTGPALRDWKINISAYLMENLSVLRNRVWSDAGFASLRDIRKEIEDYEPWFEPTVIPLSEPQDSGKAPKVSLPAPSHDPAQEQTAAPGNHLTEAHEPKDYPASKYYSVQEYHQLYLKGIVTPTDVAKFLLPLISREGEEGSPSPHFLAFFQSKAELVLQAAEASTLRYRKGRPLGPLDGVPTAVKDEYDIEGWTTCLGTADRDYTGKIKEEGDITTWCVRKLQEAGAVIIGKASMHEFGLDTSGNNPFHGTPLNPHNEDYYTGGSSSGTAYAVAAGLIPIALGSDGGGSIRIPSSMCGVFGLKPTHERVSSKPGQNHSVTCAVLGPIAGDVRSLLTVFEIIAAPHPTSPFPPFRLTGAPHLRPRVLGIPHAWFNQATPAIKKLCHTLIDRLKKAKGYEVIDIDIPYLDQGQMAHAMTVLTDAATLLPDTKGLTPANRIMLAMGSVTRATDYLLAQKLRRVIAQHLAWLWQQHPGMLIVTPTTSCAGWPIKGGAAELAHGVLDGDQTKQSMEYVWLANFLGLPSMTVPAGFVAPYKSPMSGHIVGEESGARAQVKGIPVGLMATGEWCAEEALLRWGLDCEELGLDRRARPPIWVDVIGGAEKKKDAEMKHLDHQLQHTTAGR